MALPSGLATYTLTFGDELDLTGNVGFADMQGKLTLSRPMVDSVTGSVVFQPVTFTLDANGRGSVGPLVCNDEPRVTQGTAYTVTWLALNYKPTPGGGNKTFTVSTTDGTTVDYDTIANADGTVTPGAAPQVPLVTSVEGRSGAVDLSDLFAPLGAGASGGVNPADVGYDLVLLLGQSNMSGRGTPVDTVHFDVSSPRVQQYGASGTYASVISLAIEPLAMHDTATGIGPGLAFGRWYADSVPTNRRVLLIPAAHGSTPLVSTATLAWRRGVAGNLYAQALAQTQAALALAAPNARVVAALWLQGESDGDGSVTGSAYQTDLDALIAGLRTDLGIPSLPFIIGQMVPEFLPKGTRGPINDVHLATPTRLAHVGVAYGPFASNLDDGNHYDAPGQRIVGRRMFDAYQRVAAGTAEPAVPAKPGQVVGLAIGSTTTTTAPLTWTTTSGAQGYYIEYKLNSSGTWLRGGQAHTNSFTVTGLTSDPATAPTDFRVTAVTSGGPGTPSAVVTSAGGPPDTTPPSTPTGLTATGGVAQVALSWSASTDNVAVTGYRVYRSSSLVASPAGTSYTDTGLTAGTYSYTVSAVDAAGNESAQTSSQSGTATSGVTTYAADTFTRADSGTVPGTTETGGFTWQVNASDVYGIAGNTLKAVTTTTAPADCWVDDGHIDGVIETKVTTASTVPAGIVFRATGTNGYVFYHDTVGAYHLKKRTAAGSYSVLAGSVGTAAINDVLRVEITGNTFVCKINGTTATTITDATFSGTRMGVWSLSGSAQYDYWQHTSA